jgi:hypothetical protein
LAVGGPMEWQYNPDSKQWEATLTGWRGVVARWASGAEWTATIEPLGASQAPHSAPHVFQWIEQAQAWCAAEIARQAKLPEGAEPDA